MNDQRNGGISYCDWTWSPIRGCRRVSPGCEHCYAERIAARFARPRLEVDHNPDTGDPAGVVRSLPFTGIANMTPDGPRWTGEVDLVESKLDEPLRARRSAETFLREHGRKPIVFVEDMGDLFYEKVLETWIADVASVLLLAHWFDFLILTKRAARMADLLAGDSAFSALGVIPHVWLGASAEDQPRFDERWSHLRKLAAAGWKTWISFEPLLGPVDAGRQLQGGRTLHVSADVAGMLRNQSFDCLDDDGRPLTRVEAEAQLRALLARGVKLIKGSNDCVGFSDQTGCLGHPTPKPEWIAIGGESGPGARPCAVEWVESLVSQARAAGVKCHVKQLGRYPVIRAVDPAIKGPAVIDAQRAIDLEWPLGTHFGNPTKDAALGGRVALLRDSHGADPSEWPERLRVREWPASLRGTR
jgi:protein gp37